MEQTTAEAAAHSTASLAAAWSPLCHPWRSEVIIFIQVPTGVRAKQLDVSIQPQHLRVGIQGLPPYLDVRSLVVAGGWGACERPGAVTASCGLL